MLWAMMMFTDGAKRAANRADLVLASSTRYGMGITSSVATVFVNMAMVAATALAAKGATLATGSAIPSPTLGTRRCTDRQPGTSRTFNQAGAAVGKIANRFIETRADHLAAVATAC